MADLVVGEQFNEILPDKIFGGGAAGGFVDLREHI